MEGNAILGVEVVTLEDKVVTLAILGEESRQRSENRGTRTKPRPDQPQQQQATLERRVGQVPCRSVAQTPVPELARQDRTQVGWAARASGHYAAANRQSRQDHKSFSLTAQVVSDLILTNRNCPRAHIGRIAVRLIESLNTLEFM